MKLQTLFCPGSYGTYLSWAVYTYSNLNEAQKIDLPFGPNGSAHLYRRSYGYDIITPAHRPVAGVDGTIFIAPNSFLEYTDNQLAKQSEYDNNNIIMEMYRDYYTKLNAWGDTHAHWEHRELLSLMILDTITSTRQQFSAMPGDLEKYIQVTTEQILNDICGTLHKIFEYFELVQWCDANTVESIHNTYLSLQHHRGKDRLVQGIVEDTISNVCTNIPADLTLFDEAMIQGLLRKRGYELRCYELNCFPCTTEELRSFAYQCN